MDAEKLLLYIGTEYEKLDAAGKAWGCMAPVYLLHPDIPRYDWPAEGRGFPAAVLALLDKHGHRVDPADMQPGDVVAFRMPFSFLHIGVYLGDDWLIHCMAGENMERIRLSVAAHRIVGVFRWEGGV